MARALAIVNPIPEPTRRGTALALDGRHDVE
jgi:hypothetical protein